MHKKGYNDKLGKKGILLARLILKCIVPRPFDIKLISIYHRTFKLPF